MQHFYWNLPAYPTGTWFFNPLAWQLIFVVGAWCGVGGADRIGPLLRSRYVVGAAIAFLVLALLVVMTWYFPRYAVLIPKRVQDWMYPIDKNNMDLLRFLHFCALAIVTVRFIPIDWPGLKSRWLRPMILCGQHSLEIFCLGIFLSFIGHFVTSEFSRSIGMQMTDQCIRDTDNDCGCVADHMVRQCRGARFREDVRNRPQADLAGGEA